MRHDFYKLVCQQKTDHSKNELTVTLLAEAREKLLHTLYGFAARCLSDSLLHLVVL